MGSTWAMSTAGKNASSAVSPAGRSPSDWAAATDLALDPVERDLLTASARRRDEDHLAERRRRDEEDRLRARSRTRTRLLIASGMVDRRLLVSHEFALDQADEAFAVQEKGQAIKVVVKP